MNFNLLRPVVFVQVEDQDVFPGNTVYYYGTNKEEWGTPYTVKENGCVVWQRTGPVKSFIVDCLSDSSPCS